MSFFFFLSVLSRIVKGSVAFLFFANIFEDKIILLEWKQPFACTVLMFSLSTHIVIGFCVKRVIKTYNVSHNLERTVKKKRNTKSTVSAYHLAG